MMLCLVNDGKRKHHTAVYAICWPQVQLSCAALPEALVTTLPRQQKVLSVSNYCCRNKQSCANCLAWQTRFLCLYQTGHCCSSFAVLLRLHTATQVCIAHICCSSKSC